MHYLPCNHQPEMMISTGRILINKIQHFDRYITTILKGPLNKLWSYLPIEMDNNNKGIKLLLVVRADIPCNNMFFFLSASNAAVTQGK